MKRLIKLLSVQPPRKTADEFKQVSSGFACDLIRNCSVKQIASQTMQQSERNIFRSFYFYLLKILKPFPARRCLSVLSAAKSTSCKKDWFKVDTISCCRSTFYWRKDAIYLFRNRDIELDFDGYLCFAWVADFKNFTIVGCTGKV